MPVIEPTLEILKKKFFRKAIVWREVNGKWQKSVGFFLGFSLNLDFLVRVQPTRGQRQQHQLGPARVRTDLCLLFHRLCDLRVPIPRRRLVPAEDCQCP